MYYYLHGNVASIDGGTVVIDCSGVGYAVAAPLSAVAKASKAAESGEKLKMYTHLHVREGVFELYGFASLEEKATFLMLLGISGVGPKAALSVLSSASPEELALGILNGDEKVLTSAPGIGKKIAQRIILETKDKLAKAMPGAGAAGASLAPRSLSPGGADPRQDAVSALMVLGYSASEAAGAVSAAFKDGMKVEAIIREALRSFGD